MGIDKYGRLRYPTIMVQLLEVVRDLSRAIKKRAPIVLSSIEADPADPNSIEAVYQATIYDVLRRNASGEPQAFSGVSDDSITPAELE